MSGNVLMNTDAIGDPSPWPSDSQGLSFRTLFPRWYGGARHSCSR